MGRTRTTYEKYLREILSGSGYSRQLKARAAMELRRRFGYRDEQIWELRVVRFLNRVHTEALLDVRRRCDAIGGTEGESFFRTVEMLLRSAERDARHISRRHEE